MAIKFDYNQTIGQAKLLDELANDMRNQCCKKLDEAALNIEAAWGGEAAKAYVRYVRGVSEDLMAKARYMCDTGEFLRDAAQKMDAAEKAATKAAQGI